MCTALATNSLLHAILYVDFPSFKKLLSGPGDKKDKRLETGDTPLLLCLKTHRRIEFIKFLLGKRCNVKIPDEEMRTPLQIAIDTGRLEIATLLIICGADVLEDITKKILFEAIDKKHFKFIIFLIQSRVKVVDILLPGISTSEIIGNEHDRKEIYSKLLELDRHLSKKKFYEVGEELFKYSIKLTESTEFKYIWPRLNHKNLSKAIGFLFHVYSTTCKFLNPEFIECYIMMLNSPKASVFFRIYNRYGTFYYFDNLFKIFNSRSVGEHLRAVLVLDSIKFKQLAISDILGTFANFGFNQELIILIQSEQFEKLFKRHDNLSLHALNIVKDFEKDHNLSINNLDNLGLISKLCYKKVLDYVPEIKLNGDPYEEVIKLKKKILGNVPSLQELGVHNFQRSIQHFYNITNIHQFYEIVENLCLPKALKDMICHRPPVYYKDVK